MWRASRALREVHGSRLESRPCTRPGSAAGRGGVARREDSNSGLGWPPGCVVLEILVDLGPMGSTAARAPRLARDAPERAVPRPASGPWRPDEPAGSTTTPVRPDPTVHRHRHEVAPVLDVTDDDPSRTPAASARRGQPQRPPPAPVGLHRPNRPPVARNTARCPCQNATTNQRGGSRARRPPERSLHPAVGLIGTGHDHRVTAPEAAVQRPDLSPATDRRRDIGSHGRRSGDHGTHPRCQRGQLPPATT